MTKVLIIEDEIPSRNKLKRFIADLQVPIEILAELETVQSSVAFLEKNRPDLIFSDIELLDGNAFEIYQQVSVLCPIIFVTAYDQYWMDAFDGNGIAYLLKPYTKERFLKTWEKYKLIQGSAEEQQNVILTLTKLISQAHKDKHYKKRFTVQTARGFYVLEAKDILYFEADGGVVFAYTTDDKKHLLTESTLKEIEEQLNPTDFFRINRSELIAKPHIEKMERYNKNSLLIKLKQHDRFLKTSQSTTSEFREWLVK